MCRHAREYNVHLGIYVWAHVHKRTGIHMWICTVCCACVTHSQAFKGMCVCVCVCKYAHVTHAYVCVRAYEHTHTCVPMYRGRWDCCRHSMGKAGAHTCVSGGACILVQRRSMPTSKSGHPSFFLFSALVYSKDQICGYVCMCMKVYVPVSCLCVCSVQHVSTCV